LLCRKHRLGSDSIEQRAAEWRATLRDEPTVARRLLRRLIGPLTLWDAVASEVEWETLLTPALLEGLSPLQVGTSPSGKRGISRADYRLEIRAA